MMNNEPSPMPNEPEKEAPKKKKKTKVLGFITNQWGWKLTSLVLAVCLWGGLISQDTSLPREKVFNDVRVTATNAMILRNNGFIVVSGLDEVDTVRIKVQVPQRYYNTVTASNYNVRVDLSQIKDAGEQKIRVTAAPTSTLYGSVTDISVDEITVQVEEYSAKTRIPVNAVVTGAAPDGLYLDPASVIPDPAQVDVGGPRSVVEKIAACVVETLPAAAPGPFTSTNSFYFVDREGNRLPSENLTVTSLSLPLRGILVEQEMLSLAEVPVYTDDLIFGKPAPGYHVTNVEITPQNILIADSEIVLSPYQAKNAAIHTYDKVNIDGLSESITSTLTLRTGTFRHASTHSVMVTVTIEPMGTPPEAAQQQAPEQPK